MYLFFDTETTGLPHNYKAPVTDTENWPRLVQLSYMQFSNDRQLLRERDFIIAPDGFEIPEGAADVHGITTDIAIMEGFDLSEVLEDFRNELLLAKYLVAHNIDYDRKVVGAEFVRLGLESVCGLKHVCTMKSSTGFCMIPGPYGFKWPKLQELHLALFGEGFEGAHNSLNDIRATARCFFEMLDRSIISL